MSHRTDDPKRRAYNRQAPHFEHLEHVIMFIRPAPAHTPKFKNGFISSANSEVPIPSANDMNPQIFGQ